MNTNVENKWQLPDNVIALPTSLEDGNFFRLWVEFLKPLHHLTDREMDVITAFLKKRYELSKSITDNTILDKYLVSEEIKREIREDCNITLAHFQVVMGKLKKSGVFVDGNINPKFIPNLKMDKGNLQMLLYFTF